jgi:hypothetical protein
MDLEALDIGSVGSEYEIELEEEVEKAEEFKNQFYDGLEGEEAEAQGIYKTPKYEEKINPDEYDEDIEDYIDEIDGDKFSSLFSDVDEKLVSEQNFKSPSLRETAKLQALAPVKLTEEKVLEIPEPVDYEKVVDYRTFLHQEIGESKEMYKMRVKVAELLNKADFPRGNKVVNLDAKGIISLSRMITNKLWFGMKYNKDQEELISVVVKYTPEISL